jgi:hypothetical protein
MIRPIREPTDLIFDNLDVLLDLTDNKMLTQPLRLRQIKDEVSQFSATLSRLKVGTQLRLNQVIELPI